jgi:signal transduction histidine kinase
VAEEEGRQATVEVTPSQGPIPVQVSAEDLAACLDALIGNIFAHTPAGVAFAVRLNMAPGSGAVLVVSDDGPGFPPGSAPRRGESPGGSTGLGLDIVERTAERSGGTIHIGSSGGGGAEVTVELGRSGPAARRPQPPPVSRSEVTQTALSRARRERAAARKGNCCDPP